MANVRTRSEMAEEVEEHRAGAGSEREEPSRREGGEATRHPSARDSERDAGETAGSQAEGRPSDRQPPRREVDSDAEEETRLRRLQARVRETEAWRDRLRSAQAEGTRLSQDQSRGRRDEGRDRDVETRREDRPAPRRRTDVDGVIEALDRGDDREFVGRVLDAASSRAVNRLTEERHEVQLAQRIEAAVTETAPDVPLTMFWGYTEQAIAMAPNDTVRQIEIAIALSRRELNGVVTKMRERTTRNRDNRENAETTGRGGAGPRAGEEQTAGDGEMVDEVRDYQREKRSK